MKNRYSRSDAEAFQKAHPGVNPDLALRTYTSRIIGQEADLVLHGGGNTSVKVRVENLLGNPVEVLFIKGSGWDLATIEPQGFPAVDLKWLTRLRSLEQLSDEEMVNQFRTNMLDSTAPNPSIETLVHAFLPHKHIDHTHADAIVTLTNMADPEVRIREILGDKIAVLPWIMPGFPLSKAVAELYDAQPDIEAIILLNHGIFTFSDDARVSYERMIHYVSLAEEYIKNANSQTSTATKANQVNAEIVLPILRGALARDNQAPFILHLRTNKTILEYLAGENNRDILNTGVLTPDHVIRTKNYPLWLNLAEKNEETIAAEIDSTLTAYEEDYDKYFQTQVTAKKIQRVQLDSKPRVILIPGLGIVTCDVSEKAASISADIAEHTIQAKMQGTAISPYNELGQEHIFDMEYWSLEQIKLGKAKLPPLAGKTAIITGGGGAIGCGIGRRLLAAGARIFLVDIDTDRLQQVKNLLAEEFEPGRISLINMDVTDKKSVDQGFSEVIRQTGGLDILIPNAGVAHVATLEELEESAFQKVLAVNLTGVLNVMQAAIPIFRRQAKLGAMSSHIIINSSKNVFAPGAAFGAYSASKAGAHQLGKIGAMELAEIGTRVNMINADAIFDDHGISSGLWDVVGPDRMRSRNLDPEGLKQYYRDRNLLKTEVLADHVGNAVVFFASDLTPTTGATLPVDGGVAAAFPR